MHQTIVIMLNDRQIGSIDTGCNILINTITLIYNQLINYNQSIRLLD